jgi:hypothetical protein
MTFAFIPTLLGILAAMPQMHDSAPLVLRFTELLQSTERSLKPTATLERAKGRLVAIEGFMAQMETAPSGGFWLCPTPVFQDESGAGTGDLPPTAIFVVVRGAGDGPVAHLRGKLKISGRLALSEKTPRIQILLDSKEASK